MVLRRWVTGIGAGMVLAACGGGGGGPLQPPGPPVTADTVNIVDNQFGPTAVSVVSGGTVTWTWSPNNTMQHNVRWMSGPVMPPSSPTQATGAPFEVTFTQFGTYEFVCNLHTGMQGTVFVQ